MDALIPGHAHRSSSDRLLNNYLTSQKSLNTSLLTTLSHSHSSTSSLLAYVTSSPGVHLPIRRAVRHAAFEGTHSDHSSHDEPQHHGPGWAAYVTSLETFRQDLKSIHQLEEELSRVKRDREILVTRLIKNTKSRPSKSDLAAVANGYTSDTMSSRASQLSVTSDGSQKESKRAGKLAEAQAELLGCEEHLRGLEVTIEHERNKVMQHGLADRFRAMEEVGRMWQHQARLGLQALERGPDAESLPSNAYELDSNGSIAPSQSASQVGYDDQPVSPNRGQLFPKHLAHVNGNHGHGSITGSIAEEDEDGGSSGSDDDGNYVVHENKAGNGAKKTGSVATATRSQATATARSGPGPKGVPSVNAPVRPLNLRRGSDASDAGTAKRASGLFSSRSGGRRAASEVGYGYNPPQRRLSLRRTASNDNSSKKPSRRSGGSDAGSSVGSYKKRKGFFSAIKGFFKANKRGSGSSIRSGRDSPPYGSSSVGRSRGGWNTRTDANIKRSASKLGGGGGRRRDDDSSSDEDGANLVAVQNVGKDRWAVDNAGVGSGSKPKGKRQSSSSTIPVASGLIPAPRPTRAELGAGSRATSTSTITPATSKPAAKASSASVTRSNTAKSTASNTNRNRKNGSIARATSTGPTTGRTIMSLVDADKANEGPRMIDVPTAPRSQVIPSLMLPKAPGSSLVLPSDSKPRPASYAPSVTPSQSVSQAGKGRKDDEDEDEHHLRPVTPSLPPSRSLSPPLKSAMRPSSPAPSPQKPEWTKMEAPKMTTVTAPGRVTSDAPREDKPAPAAAPAPVVEKAASAADDASIYESAREDEDGEDDDVGSSDEEEDMSKLQVVENDRVKKAAGIEPVSEKPKEEAEEEHSTPKAKAAELPEPAELGPPATAPPRVAPSVAGSDMTADGDGAKVRRRKSVRMNVPDTPDSPMDNPLQAQQAAPPAVAASPQRESAGWSTRIGKSRDESSDEEGAAYVKAKRTLSRNSGKWETVNGADKAEKKTKRKSKA